MTDFVAGFFAPWIIYAVMLGLHLVLPARRVTGYVTDAKTGKPLTYRLNGLLVLAAVVVLWVVIGATGALPWDWLYTHRWSGLIGSAVLGLLLSVLALVFGPAHRAQPARRPVLRPVDEPPALRGPGRRQDVPVPHRGGHAGAQPAAFTAHHVIEFGDAYSPGVVLYCVLFFWFSDRVPGLRDGCTSTPTTSSPSGWASSSSGDASRSIPTSTPWACGRPPTGPTPALPGGCS